MKKVEPINIKDKSKRFFVMTRPLSNNQPVIVEELEMSKKRNDLEELYSNFFYEVFFNSSNLPPAVYSNILKFIIPSVAAKIEKDQPDVFADLKDYFHEFLGASTELDSLPDEASRRIYIINRLVVHFAEQANTQGLAKVMVTQQDFYFLMENSFYGIPAICLFSCLDYLEQLGQTAKRKPKKNNN